MATPGASGPKTILAVIGPLTHSQQTVKARGSRVFANGDNVLMSLSLFFVNSM